MTGDLRSQAVESIKKEVMKLAIKEASRISQISTSTIRRMFEIVEIARKKGIDVINLSIGEPDFDTHKLIIEKASKAMMDGYTHYTSNFGIEELREEISKRYRARGADIAPENIMLTTGASEALLNASLAFIERGSKVVVPSPSFLGYYTYVKICEAELINLKTHDNQFRVDPENLNEVMGKDVSVIFLNYPNNPTGCVMDQRELKAIAEIAYDYDSVVISDEVYDAIYYDKKPGTLAGYDNVIVINAFSKSLAMTGWRVGFAIAEQEMLEKMLRIHQLNGVCAPAFAQKAVAEIMIEGKDRIITAEMVSEFRKRRDFVYSKLLEMGFKVVKPEGAFYFFPEYNGNSSEFVERLIMEKGVALTPGIPFGEGNERYFRISYATSMEKLKEAMERIEEFLG